MNSIREQGVPRYEYRELPFIFQDQKRDLLFRGKTSKIPIRDKRVSYTKEQIIDVSKDKILIIDDSRAARDFISECLKSIPADFFTAGDGTEALDLIERKHFDLIITDIDMPGLDGVELCKKLKASPRTGTIPVIIVSNFDSESAINRGFEAGAAAYIPKKKAETDLLPVVQKTLAEYGILSTKKVLLVENSHKTADYIRTGLINNGFSVITTADPEDALLNISQIHFSLVISEIDLGPELNGIDLLQKARQICNKDIPFIILGKQSSSGRLKRAIQLGAAAFLIKPFNPDQLAFLIKKIIHDESVIEEAEKQKHLTEIKFQKIIEESEDGIAITDDEGKFILWNDSMQKITGIKEDEVLGSVIWEFDYQIESGGDSDALPLDAYRQKYKKFLSDGKIEDSFKKKLYQFDHPDGSFIIAESVLFPIKLSGNYILACISRDITRRLIAEKEAHEALKENKLLMKEIHHRVKNNLQIIISLLNLQRNNIRDPDGEAIVLDSMNRIQAMAMLHELLYEENTISEINIQRYLTNLVHTLHSTFEHKQRIRTNCRIDDFYLRMDKAINIGLLVNELYTNAVKHAFPDREEGTIDISLHKNGDGQYQLSVKDDGKGLPDQFDPEGTGTLGIQLIDTLTGQIGGTLQYRPDIQAGTEVSICFPIMKNPHEKTISN